MNIKMEKVTKDWCMWGVCVFKEREKKKEKKEKKLILILVHKTWGSIHIDKRTSIMEMKIATL